MEMKSESGIYRIHNITNGMSYIGQSIDVSGRCRDHRRQLKKGKHSNVRLQSDYILGGSIIFTYQALAYGAVIALKALEDYWINYYRPTGLYNVTKASVNPTLGRRKRPFKNYTCPVCGIKFRRRKCKVNCKDPTCSKTCQFKKPRRPESEETKLKRRQNCKPPSHKGLKRSDITKAKLSAALMGNCNGLKHKSSAILITNPTKA